jgi:hypothetical protein
VGLSNYQPARQLLQLVNQETNNTQLGRTALGTENDNNNSPVPEPPAAASAGSTSNVPAVFTTVEIANGSSPTTQVATRQVEEKRKGRKRRAGTRREDDDLVDATVANMGAATATPVTARVANKR